MKATKKALQRNCIINEDFYTDQELSKMFYDGEIFTITLDCKAYTNIRKAHKEFKMEHGNDINGFYHIDITPREDDIKVVVDEYGYYSTVLVKTINGQKKTYHIEL